PSTGKFLRLVAGAADPSTTAARAKRGRPPRRGRWRRPAATIDRSLAWSWHGLPAHARNVRLHEVRSSFAVSERKHRLGSPCPFQAAPTSAYISGSQRP